MKAAQDVHSRAAVIYYGNSRAFSIAIIGKNSVAVSDNTTRSVLILGPAVSLNGSPTISPRTDESWT
jgi:hypothetical protein